MIALLALLMALSSSRNSIEGVAALALLALIGAVAAARLPVVAVIARACVVLPFSGIFALSVWLAGDGGSALALVLRSYLSALAALLFISTTPLSSLLVALGQYRAPRFLLETMQFLHRYLFLLMEEAQHIRTAALSRGGFRGARGFRAAGGALGTLFARSYSRAIQIHHAMLARGFQGQIPVKRSPELGFSDVLFASVGVAFAAVLRFGVAG